jgi:hypothetical protein
MEEMDNAVRVYTLYIGLIIMAKEEVELMFTLQAKSSSSFLLQRDPPIKKIASSVYRAENYGHKIQTIVLAVEFQLRKIRTNAPAVEF